MKKLESIKGSTLIHVAYIMIMLGIIAAGIMIVMIVHNAKKPYVTEQWVYEYLEKSDFLSELDAQILSKNLSEKIDEKMEGFGAGGSDQKNGELTKDQLLQIMTMVNKELQYAEPMITQEELSQMTADISEEMIKKYLSDMNHSDQLEVYQTEINLLKEQITNLRKSVEGNGKNKLTANVLTADQVRSIVAETNLTEEDIQNMIKDLLGNVTIVDRDFYENIEGLESNISEVASILSVSEETLFSLSDQSADMKDQISYLAKRLGITERKLEQLLAKTSVENSDGLMKALNEIAAAQSTLQQQMENNQSVAMSSVSSLQKQVTNNKTAVEKSISQATKESTEMLKQHTIQAQNEMSDNTDALNKKITELNEASATKEALSEAQEALVSLVESNTQDNQEKLKTAVEKLNDVIAEAGDKADADLKTARDALQAALDREGADREDAINEAIATAQTALDNSIVQIDGVISDIDAEIAGLQNTITSMRKDINDNKKYTDTSIEELQKNVLFYEYDAETNTLHFFEKE